MTKKLPADSNPEFIFVDGERPLSTLDAVMILMVSCIALVIEGGAVVLSVLKPQRSRVADIPPNKDIVRPSR
ncbi:MAG: hypothetical protein EYC62_07940 [Alphaproteobacteria bacterium]|nr:MAG: hypothetical protein EYC62_07940 [Alphaproteobacteria bacterium]